MYRIEEMKAWQKEQQSKLLKAQQHQEDNFLKAQKEQILNYLSQNENDFARKDMDSAMDLERLDESRTGDNGLSLNPANEYDTEESRKNRIKYLEALLDECYHKKALLEEMPISPSYQDFSKLLEMSLLQDKENYPEERVESEKEEDVERIVEKPKRPFLRKGEGLARFRMTADDFKQPVKMNFYRSQSHSTLKNSANNKSSVNKQPSRTSQLAQPKSKFTTSKSGFKAPAPSLKSCRSAPLISVSQASQKSNFPASILKKPSNTQAASAFGHQENSKAHQDSDQKKKKEQRELRVFEILEEKVGESSFCSTSSTIAKLMEDSVKSTPLKESDNFGQAAAKTTSESAGNSQTAVNSFPSERRSDQKIQGNDDTEVEDDDAWTDISSSDEGSVKGSNDDRDQTGFTSDDSRHLCSPPPNFQKHAHFNDDEIYQSSVPYSITRKDFEDLGLNFQPESLIPNGAKVSETKKNEPKSARVQGLSNGNANFKNELLQQRLEDLEKEIEIFRKENAKLAKSKQEFESEKSNFVKQKREFEAKMKKFREEDEARLAEERKKLQKEKLVFERYTKEVRSKPNKQEREEIKLLRNEIADLKKELERREGKWGSSQARIRNQMKDLEKDNTNLREQIINLQKESSQKQLISKGIKLTDNMTNTNIIHAINRQLSQLTPEDIEELLSKREQILKKPNFINKPGAAKTNAKQSVLKEKPIVGKPVLKKSTGNPIKTQKKVQISIKNARNVDFSSSSSEPENDDIINDVVNKPVLKAIYPEEDDIVLKQYEDEFFNLNAPVTSRLNVNETEAMSERGDIIECVSVDGNREKIFPDGRKEIWFPNGNVKKMSADGNVMKIIYYNGDVKETIISENIVKYYYAESKTWHTTYKDGLEILEFSNGQVEKRLTNEVVEISFPNGCGRRIFPDGREEWTFSDRSVLKTDKKTGFRMLELPNGQKEYHTAEYKKREFPDGTVKLVYPDGTQETRYANGRVRLKDKNGKLIMDSDSK